MYNGNEEEVQNFRALSLMRVSALKNILVNILIEIQFCKLVLASTALASVVAARPCGSRPVTRYSPEDGSQALTSSLFLDTSSNNNGKLLPGTSSSTSTSFVLAGILEYLFITAGTSNTWYY